MLYIVKNINTNEISEQDIPDRFIDELLEKGQEYKEFVKPTLAEIHSFIQGKSSESLDLAKKNKKALVDKKRDEVINEKTIPIKISGDFINLKLDDKTRNEIRWIDQDFISGKIIDKTFFGDAVDKTTKEITKDTIRQYILLSNNFINGDENQLGIYSKARAIKEDIDKCTSVEEVENVCIDFF